MRRSHGDVDTEEARRVAEEVRAFLEPLWTSWHAGRRASHAMSSDLPYPHARASASMCRWTAIVLSEVLREETGHAWKVKGGDTWLPKYPTGGMRDASGEWHGHYWVETGDVIVDVTADQFGHEEVVVERGTHPRYEGNFTAAEIRTHLRDAGMTSRTWLSAWAERQGPAPGGPTP